jgi:hypothetical protein
LFKGRIQNSETIRIRPRVRSTAVVLREGEAQSSLGTVMRRNGLREEEMNFLNLLLRGISFIPTLVSAIETMFASKSGIEKKDAAMSFLENALQMSDAVAQREIVDPEHFRDGVSRIIDGVVECMNASAWAKEKGPIAVASKP